MGSKLEAVVQACFRSDFSLLVKFCGHSLDQNGVTFGVDGR